MEEKCIKIKSIKKLEEKQDVYNMQVENYHNYSVEGGLIIHNCDSLIYATDYIRNINKGTRF